MPPAETKTATRYRALVVLAAVLVVLLLALLVVAHANGARRAELAADQEQLQALSSAAAELAGLLAVEKRRPWLASQQRLTELGAFLEEAAHSAGIEKPRLAAINALPSRRLDSYVGEQQIEVTVDQVQLEELTRFLFAIQTREGAPSIKELTLTISPRAKGRWTATVILSSIFLTESGVAAAAS